MKNKEESASIVVNPSSDLMLWKDVIRHQMTLQMKLIKVLMFHLRKLNHERLACGGRESPMGDQRWGDQRITPSR
jgi:hypothetical protein